jgi:predicted CoA-binding protein
MPLNVAILGATDKKDRYAYLALILLREKGHQVFPINPHLDQIDGFKVYPSLKTLPRDIHTVTVYINKSRSSMVLEDLVALGPRRVILNPGAENEDLEGAVKAAGIELLHGCTLVMLRTGRF